MSEQPLEELTFILAGEAFRQVRDWQVVSDQAVIRANLEKRGIAQVIRTGGQADAYQPGGAHPAGKRQVVETVRSMPAPGQAEPFYGPRGGGYRYTFDGCLLEAMPAAGCRVVVENTGLERLRAAGYAPLVLGVEPPGEAEQAPDGNGASPAAPLDLDDPQVQRQLKDALEGGRRRVRELRFVIDAELLRKLAAWGRWGESYAAYAFSFRPLSTGTEMRVRHVATGEVFALSDG